MKPESFTQLAEVQGKTLTFETGKLAGQAGGAVTLRLGDSLVFAAATMSKEPRMGIDFFPLSVDYEEKMYAGGRIPGGFFRREGRQSEEAILISRLTDRPLRPLFPDDLRNDVQVVLYAFSADTANPLDVLCINAASAAVMISDAPWNGPVGAVRVALVDGEFVVNPTYDEIAKATLDLRIAGTRDAILMVECGAYEIPEAQMVKALELGHQSIQPIIDAQLRLVAQVGKPKSAYTSFKIAEDLAEKVLAFASPKLEAALSHGLSKVELSNAVDAIKAEAKAAFVTEAEDSPKDGAVSEALEEAYKKVVRRRILELGARPDGRKTTEIRPIWCEVGMSPMAHGCGLFTRGETQIFTLATLGTPREAQELDNLTPLDRKRYMHHYNFPPFSTGEVRPLRGSSRREIGHGVLAERALIPVLPPEDKFPYTLRLVSEALSSNGSTSMGSVCGSTLALMDAGVPIKAPVAGIAMGLIKEGDRYTILSDIQGVEDHLGDMDFKVAGTDKGITALQMDIKISGLTAEIMSQALEQARLGRIHIMNKMMEVLPAPRPDLKPHAPRITTVKIPVDKIGALIGPGGKNIRSIQEETGAKIDINEDGTVFIATSDGVAARAALDRIQGLTEVPQIGHIYTGTVKRVENYGAFVEILPGQEGLVHISQLDSVRVENIDDVVALGDEITVMVTNIDPEGKIRLSRQAVLEGWTAEEAADRDRPGPSRSSGGGGRDRRGGGDRGGDRGGRGFRR